MIDITRIPYVFKCDRSGLAVPELAEGNEWLFDPQRRRVTTIILDGYYIKIQGQHGHWRILGFDERGTEYEIPLSEGKNDYEKAILQAYDDLWSKQAGLYVLYGRGIMGNPYGMPKAKLLRVSPCNYNLIVPNYANREEACKVNLKTALEPQILFQQVKEEFYESPMVVGLMFQEEGNGLEMINAARVLRTQFGLEWLPKAKTEVTIVH